MATARSAARRPRVGALLDVTVPGFAGRVHVREDGPADAPALVLIHGFTASLQWYDDIVARLAADHRLVRIDLIGHGSTGGPARDAPVQAGMVAAVLEQLDLTAAAVVGHSFGADVAATLAEENPRVERLVIVAQAPDYADATLPRGSRVTTVPVLGRALVRSTQVLAAAGGVALRAARRSSPNRTLVAQGLRDLRAVHPDMFRVVLVDRRDRMTDRPLDAQVLAAGKPTLVILGGRDHFYGDRSAPRYRAAGAQVEILPESGHSPLLDHAGEVAALLRRFVTRTTGAA